MKGLIKIIRTTLKNGGFKARKIGNSLKTITWFRFKIRSIYYTSQRARWYCGIVACFIKISMDVQIVVKKGWFNTSVFSQNIIRVIRWPCKKNGRDIYEKNARQPIGRVPYPWWVYNHKPTETRNS